MAKRVFSREELLNEVDALGSAVYRNIVDQDRWHTYYEIVFPYEGKFYMTTYGVGSTEIQDVGPWEYQDEIECWEVEKRVSFKEEWVPVDEEPEVLIVVIEKGNRNTPMISATNAFTVKDFFAFDPNKLGWRTFFYTTRINVPNGLQLLSKERLEREFGKYSDTDMYKYIMDRSWRR